MPEKHDKSYPRVIVVQIGARHAYAVPTVFERAGILEGFYTDMCAGRGVGRLAEYLTNVLPGSRSLKGLASRRPTDAVLAKTRTFDGVAIQHALRTVVLQSIERRFKENLRYNSAFGSRANREGFGNATHVYSIFAEGDVFLETAKRAGKKIVTDVIIALTSEQIVLDEYHRFPDWGRRPLDQRKIMGPQFQPAEIMLKTTDIFVCPSEFVREDLIMNWGVDREATRVVPYGVADHWFQLRPQPEPGRILFAGTADLRKGIHYFAMAADKLKSRRRKYEFRVVGGVTKEVRSQPLCQALAFLGRVSRNDVYKELVRADVLVLPTLAEGSAGVIYEALAAGVPVVTTRAAGSVVRHGVDGLIVAERDPDMLADAIESIVENRCRQSEMGQSGRARARQFTWEQYGTGLVSALGAKVA